MKARIRELGIRRRPEWTARRGVPPTGGNWGVEMSSLVVISTEDSPASSTEWLLELLPPRARFRFSGMDYRLQSHRRFQKSPTRQSVTQHDVRTQRSRPRNHHHDWHGDTFTCRLCFRVSGVLCHRQWQYDLVFNQTPDGSRMGNRDRHLYVQRLDAGAHDHQSYQRRADLAQRDGIEAALSQSAKGYVLVERDATLVMPGPQWVLARGPEFTAMFLRALPPPFAGTWRTAAASASSGG